MEISPETFWSPFTVYRMLVVSLMCFSSSPRVDGGFIWRQCFNVSFYVYNFNRLLIIKTMDKMYFLWLYFCVWFVHAMCLILPL